MKSYKEMKYSELNAEIIRVRKILKGEDDKKHNPKHLRDLSKYYQKLCNERNEYIKNRYENKTN